MSVHVYPMKTEEYYHPLGQVTNPRCDLLFGLFGSQIVEDGIFEGVRLFQSIRIAWTVKVKIEISKN